MTDDQVKSLRRRIEDYLRKYASEELLVRIATMIGIKVVK